jgi:mannose/fructose/N-acetylgalactosamine-specific phosphotransferase system component IIB
VPVVLARVDNRLVHGQVLEAWVPRLGVESILVVDGELAADPFQRAVIEGLGLGEVGIRLCTPEEAADLLRNSLRGQKTLLLFAGVAQALEALKRGVRFERLNLGNLHPRQGGRSLTPSVYLTPADEGGLRELLSQGVALEARAVPNDRTPDIAALVKSGDPMGDGE